jgi:hypothetical protein
MDMHRIYTQNQLATLAANSKVLIKLFFGQAQDNGVVGQVFVHDFHNFVPFFFNVVGGRTVSSSVFCI